MNIFILDRDPVENAHALGDKHVTLLLKDVTTVLATVLKEDGYLGRHTRFSERWHSDELELISLLCKPTNPYVRLAKRDIIFFQWLVCFGLALAEEYLFRNVRYEFCEQTTNSFNCFRKIKHPTYRSASYITTAPNKCLAIITVLHNLYACLLKPGKQGCRFSEGFIPDNPRTPTKFPLFVPHYYRGDDIVEAYRLYYINDKTSAMKYTKRKPPKWVTSTTSVSILPTTLALTEE